MLERDRHDTLFATPLLRYRADDPETLNAALMATMQAMRSGSAGVEKSNRGGWHSEGNLFDSDAPAIRQVAAMARHAVLDATEQVGAKAAPDSLEMKLFAWMNANPQGGFNAPHSHPGAHWSGVYYVSQPETDDDTSGMIEFLDPRSDLPNWRLLKAAPFRPKKKLRPRPGEMILFPSYLVHWVYPNEAAEERVSIAFNATFRKARKTDAEG